MTGEQRHLDLAQLLIDRRGRNTMRGHAGYGPVYQQDHVPVRQATEVAGHAVRQLYLTTGVTDLVMERDEQALLDAMLTLWADMTGRKLYITGGIGSRFDGEAFGGPYELPADGQVSLTVRESPSAPWALSLRVPEWCRRYTVSLNGNEVTPLIDKNGYLIVDRSWQLADELILTLQMEPEFIAPHPRIDSIRGCGAVQRGPLVYCFESHDQPAGVDLLDVKVVTDEPLSVAPVDILGGVMAVHVAGRATTDKWGGSLYQPLEEVSEAESRRVQLVAMPYFDWGNRGMQSMRVWVPRQE